MHVAPSDPVIFKPSAWHNDLHVENIFVDPTEPTKVSSIVDWQSTEVVPMFVNARQPFIVDHEGPQAVGLDRPCRPDNFAELSPEERKAANRLLLDQALAVAYRKWIKGRSPDIWKAFEYQETPAADLLLLARALLVDGEALYCARVLEHLHAGDDLLGNSGLAISEQVRTEIDADAEAALRGMDAMGQIKAAMGDLFPEVGCVKVEHYDEAKEALQQLKGQIIDKFATTEEERVIWEEVWPFDD